MEEINEDGLQGCENHRRRADAERDGKQSGRSERGSTEEKTNRVAESAHVPSIMPADFEDSEDHTKIALVRWHPERAIQFHGNLDFFRLRRRQGEAKLERRVTLVNSYRLESGAVHGNRHMHGAFLYGGGGGVFACTQIRPFPDPRFYSHGCGSRHPSVAVFDHITTIIPPVRVYLIGSIVSVHLPCPRP